MVICLNGRVAIAGAFQQARPPVQYLLEALNRTNGPMEGVYAFQSGDSNYANLRWSHKGVTPVAYDSAGPAGSCSST